jgi:TRAP-type uncharacterized transport system substrate-binding protein
VAAVSTGVITGGWLCYRYFGKPIVLTVAAGSVDGEALSLISAVAARLTASNAHVRLKVVDSNTSAKASELLAAHKADLAVVRGDTGGLEDARSVLVLTHGVVLLMASSTAGGDNLGDLRNTTIGVIGARLTVRR